MPTTQNSNLSEAFNPLLNLSLWLLILSLGILPSCDSKSSTENKQKPQETAKASNPSSSLKLVPPHKISFPQFEDQQKAQLLSQAKTHHQRAYELILKNTPSTEIYTNCSSALQLYLNLGVTLKELSSMSEIVAWGEIKAQRFDLAQKTLKTWLSHHPKDRAHRELLAGVFLETHQHRACSDLFIELDKEKPITPAQREVLIQALALSGDREEASNRLNGHLDQLKTQPKDLSALSPDAHLSSDQKKSLRLAMRIWTHFEFYNRALPYAEMLHKLNPDDPEVKLELGITYNQLTKYEKAQTLLRQLLNHSSYSSLAHQHLSSSLIKQGKAKEAAHLLKDLLIQSPYEAQAYHQLAMAFRRLGKLNQAKVFDAAQKKLSPSRRQEAKVGEYRSQGNVVEETKSQVLQHVYSGNLKEVENILSRPNIEDHPELKIFQAQLYTHWLRIDEALSILNSLNDNQKSTNLTPKIQKEITDTLNLAKSKKENPKSTTDTPSTEDFLRIKICQTPFPKSRSLMLSLAHRLHSKSYEASILRARVACLGAENSESGPYLILAQLLNRAEDIFYRANAIQEGLKREPNSETLLNLKSQLDRYLDTLLSK